MKNTFLSKTVSSQTAFGYRSPSRAWFLAVALGLSFFAALSEAHPEHQDKPLSSQFPLPTQPGPQAPGR
jgi:hypothetical protein